MIKLDKYGISPLHIAVKHKNWSLLQQLTSLAIEKEVRIPDGQQWQDIHECAAIFQHVIYDNYSLLCKMDADEKCDMLFVAAKFGMWRHLLLLIQLVFPSCMDFSHCELAISVPTCPACSHAIEIPMQHNGTRACNFMNHINVEPVNKDITIDYQPDTHDEEHYHIMLHGIYLYQL
jgi:hypothetical protein